jgi:truncated hemoglobin YjbI
MKAFLMMALGGPAKFTGKDMRTAHVRLIRHGLTDNHFNTVGKHLQSSLKEFGVDDSICREISKVFESCRNDVLNK